MLRFFACEEIASGLFRVNCVCDSRLHNAQAMNEEARVTVLRSRLDITHSHENSNKFINYNCKQYFPISIFRGCCVIFRLNNEPQMKLYTNKIFKTYEYYFLHFKPYNNLLTTNLNFHNACHVSTRFC